MLQKIKHFPDYLKRIKDDLLHHIPNARKNTDELVWAQVFNSTITNSTWLKNQSFSPGRWAIGYPGLYILYRTYNDIKPKNVLEFGLGESSKLLIQYHNSFDSEISIVDHNKEWIDFFSQTHYNIDKYIKVLPTYIKIIDGKQTLTYNQIDELYKVNHYNLIVIDGPYGSNSYSRSQIIDLVENNCLHDDFIIIMDDYNRPGEVQTMNKVEKILHEKGIRFKTGVYRGQKDTYILCSLKYQYLCEL